MQSGIATNHSYHFFGDLWLGNPEEYLSAEELERFRSLEPLIRQLECRRQGGDPVFRFQELDAYSPHS